MEYRKSRARFNLSDLKEPDPTQIMFSSAVGPATQGTSEAHSYPQIPGCHPSTCTNRGDLKTGLLTDFNTNIFCSELTKYVWYLKIELNSQFSVLSYPKAWPFMLNHLSTTTPSQFSFGFKIQNVDSIF